GAAGDRLEMAGGGVTPGAVPAEERLAGLRVADDDARRTDARLVVSGGAEGVDERGEVGHLIVGEWKLRHAAIDASVANNRRDELAVLILEHDRRSQQAGPGVAATRIRAVTETAID